MRGKATMSPEELIWWTSCGAAVGGFVGTFIFFLDRYGFELWWARPSLIKTYRCANEPNQGQPDEEPGQLMHHHGRRIAEKSEYKKLGASNPIWEWSRTETGRPTDKQPIKSIIYGPYSTDCPEPGPYVAIFKIKAIGLAKADEMLAHLTLLTLDVNHITHEYVAFETGRRLDEVHRTVAVSYVRADTLAKEGWQEFKVPFYSDASGKWEYRVIAKDGQGDKPDNISNFGNRVRIFFDTIQIRLVRKLKLPWH